MSWILENGFASEDAMERIADAIGIGVGSILLPDETSSEENAIEFLKDSDRATVTFSQGRYKTRIKRLAKKHPESCEIIAENNNGSILAHIPVSWVKISPPVAQSEKQKELARLTLEKARSVVHEKGPKPSKTLQGYILIGVRDYKPKIGAENH